MKILKSYEMSQRHKKELIDTFIKPYVPFKNDKSVVHELSLSDNSMDEPMYIVEEIFQDGDNLVVHLFSLAQWSYGEITTMNLENLEYDHLETIAEYFERRELK